MHSKTNDFFFFDGAYSTTAVDAYHTFKMNPGCMLYCCIYKWDCVSLLLSIYKLTMKAFWILDRFQACVYLEDARPANDRALEVPREMKLSLVRWDCPETDERREGIAAGGGAPSKRSETSHAGARGGRRPLGGGRGEGGQQQQQQSGGGVSGDDERGARRGSAEGRSDDDE